MAATKLQNNFSKVSKSNFTYEICVIFKHGRSENLKHCM